ncbi:hypothetical protein Q757_01250 [Oenococcus alcoholitolerans]|uniref:Uncharacterized protein n=1 Tax=Oenococcus alcoholitolerans TaxID=931074 RepID=A0ABR4XSY8_9LACO|nr:hypothetical protein Q757_01250 [Oenococcus alcoholitolerans]
MSDYLTFFITFFNWLTVLKKIFFKIFILFVYLCYWSSITVPLYSKVPSFEYFLMLAGVYIL